MGPALAVAWWLRHRSVRSFWPYVLIGGTLSWGALHFGGLHPALALVPIVPFMPCHGSYHDLFDERSPPTTDTLNRFASWWRVPVQIVLFFFGLVNAGVPLAGAGHATWLVSIGLLVGKPIGIVGATMVATGLGLRRPAGMQYADIVVVGTAAAIGFTVALFFSTAAFPPGSTLDEAKIGALLSLSAVPLTVAGSRYRAQRRRRA